MNAITGLQDAALRARTATGVWTPAELLAHLYSTEHIFTERARKAVKHPGYMVVPVSDEVKQEHLGMAKQMPVPQIIHALLAQRRETLEFVRTLSEGDLALTLQHPVRGEQTALWQIEHVIEHEVEHAEEISRRRPELVEATT